MYYYFRRSINFLYISILENDCYFPEQSILYKSIFKNIILLFSKNSFINSNISKKNYLNSHDNTTTFYVEKCCIIFLLEAWSYMYYLYQYFWRLLGLCSLRITILEKSYIVISLEYVNCVKLIGSQHFFIVIIIILDCPKLTESINWFCMTYFLFYEIFSLMVEGKKLDICHSIYNDSCRGTTSGHPQSIKSRQR